MLAREILPYLAELDVQVDVWGRRDEWPVEAPRMTYGRLGSTIDRVTEPAALVVAAPISSRDIAAYASPYTIINVLVDLRAEGATDPAPRLGTVKTLTDIFAEFDQAAALARCRVADARADIRACAHAFAARAKINPSGWHDLCA